MKMKEVLYVLGLKKNLLSISDLDNKGYRVAFIDGQVLMWSKGKTLEDVNGIQILIKITTCPYINANLCPFLSRAKMESKFFFKPGTYSTSFIFMEVPESNYKSNTISFLI